MTCYPQALGGLLADVNFGHFKIIRASLITMAVSIYIFYASCQELHIVSKLLLNVLL